VLFRSWTIDPQLTATVDLDTAEARLFGRALNLNFRGMVERKVREKVAGFATDMNRRMRTDDTIRNEAGKAWNALHLVTSVYRSPPVWVSMTPKSVGVAPPVVTDEDLILRTAATVHASVHVRREPPAIGSVALPGLTPLTTPGGEFSLAVPVALELNSFHAVPPGNLKLPDTFETPAGRVHVRRLFLLGDAGTLYVGAEVTARTGLLERVSGTVYLAGQPVLDEDGNTLRIENLRYDVRTSNELVRTANVLLHPAVLAELRKRAVFNMEPPSGNLRALANAGIARWDARLPPGIELEVNVREVRVADIIVDKGWLVAVTTAVGPARVRISALGEEKGSGTFSRR